MIFKRSQTATEYLIILAVVVVIALLVVSVLGGIPSSVDGISDDAARIQLANYGPLKIDDWVVFRNETRITVQNIENDIIKLNSVYINGTQTVLNKTLRVGEEYFVVSPVAMLTPGSFSFPISFTWTDVSTGSTYTENSSEAILTGDSVDNPYGVYVQRNGRGQDLNINDQFFDRWVVGTDYFVVHYVDKGNDFLTTWQKASSSSNYCGSATLGVGTASISINGCDSYDTSQSIHDFNVTNIQTDVYITLDFDN